MKSNMLVLALILIPGFLIADYWQQKVNYDIDVTLVDSLHQVTGHETITYINNSTYDLDFIWMHLWPNAYKNNESALAKQKFNDFSTKMHFLPDSSFGWIEISEVSAGGEDLKWEYRSADTLDVAKFYLSETLLSGDTLIIDLDFTVQVPNVLSRMGHFGHHYEMTQWHPKPAVYDLKGWHPMSYLDRGEFYSEWGDFDVSITLPDNYRVAATGVLQDSSEIIWRDSLALIGNAYLDSFQMDPEPKLESLDTLFEAKPTSSLALKTITYKQENVHGFAWFADKRFIITRNEVELPSGKLTQTWTFALPANLKNYRLSNEYIADAVSYYSNRFMEYPYEHVTVVDGDFSAGGGMEYPMITLINNTGFQPILELVIMHEVGHNWFYGLSASNERDYPWMDEGLNSYAENRYWANKYSDDSMLAHHGKKPVWLPLLEIFLKDLTKSAIEDLSYYLSAGAKLDQAPNLHSEAFSDFNYGMMVYKKASLSTESLDAYFGEAFMDSIWHEYFRRWAYKHPQPEDIRQVFEEVSGEDLSWYFDDMLGSTGKIDYALDDFTSVPRGNTYETTVQVNNHGDFTPPLPIGLSGSGESESKTAWVHPTGEHDVFLITTEFPVQNVVLDPDLVLLDMDRRNNDKKLNLDFDLMKLALNPQADYVVTMIPYIWYDSVDRITPGLILTHKNFMPWGTDWYLRTFYGAISQTTGFVASAGKKLFPQRGKEIKLHSRIAHDWHYQLAEVSSTFRKRDLFLSDNKREWKIALFAQDLSNGEIVVNNDTIRYLDQQVWEAGQLLKTTLSYTKESRRTLWNREVEFKGSLGIRDNGKSFAKFQSHFKYRIKYSGKGSIRSTLFAGYAIGDLPRHERFYLSTDMDPKFNNNKLVLSRNDAWYTMGHLLLFPNQYTIPGYLYSDDTGLIPSTMGLLGAKLRVDIPKLESLSILTGAGMILDQNDEKFQAIGSISPVWKSGPFQLVYTPIRLESGQLETDWTRFQIAFDMSTISIRIGI